MSGIVWYCMPYIFFFSSRRRHTSSLRDWSSDVCSSDLSFADFLGLILLAGAQDEKLALRGPSTSPAAAGSRSEERRVGKECRSRRRCADSKKAVENLPCVLIFLLSLVNPVIRHIKALGH